MLKVRKILRLKLDVGLSLRSIGRICPCGKSTVSEILDKDRKANLSLTVDLSDKQLI